MHDDSAERCLRSLRDTLAGPEANAIDGPGLRAWAVSVVATHGRAPVDTAALVERGRWWDHLAAPPELGAVLDLALSDAPDPAQARRLVDAGLTRLAERRAPQPPPARPQPKGSAKAPPRPRWLDAPIPSRTTAPLAYLAAWVAVLSAMLGLIVAGVAGWALLTKGGALLERPPEALAVLFGAPALLALEAWAAWRLMLLLRMQHDPTLRQVGPWLLGAGLGLIMLARLFAG